MATTKTRLGFIDITVPISNAMPTWPADPGVSILPASRIEEGDLANVTSICMGSHTGTHLDPPSHLIEGAPSSDQVPLERMIGECRVVEVGPTEGSIGADELGAFLPFDTERLLVKTSNSRLWSQPAFFPDFVSLSPDAAQLLVDEGVRLVGMDYLSIEAFASEDLAVHRTLFTNDVIVLEGLDLTSADPGHYQLIALPLSMQGMDGVPVRAILEPFGP